jgi:hypothetical protein
MDTYEIELEPAEPDGFTAIIPAFPGLLILGSSVDEVLDAHRAPAERELRAQGPDRRGSANATFGVQHGQNDWILDTLQGGGRRRGGYGDRGHAGDDSTRPPGWCARDVCLTTPLRVRGMTTLSVGGSLCEDIPHLHDVHCARRRAAVGSCAECRSARHPLKGFALAPQRRALRVTGQPAALR